MIRFPLLEFSKFRDSSHVEVQSPANRALGSCNGGALFKPVPPFNVLPSLAVFRDFNFLVLGRWASFRRRGGRQNISKREKHLRFTPKRCGITPRLAPHVRETPLSSEATSRMSGEGYKCQRLRKKSYRLPRWSHAREGLHSKNRNGLKHISRPLNRRCHQLVSRPRVD